MADPDNQAQLGGASAVNGSAANPSAAIPSAATSGAATSGVARSGGANGSVALTGATTAHGSTVSSGSKRDSADIVAEIERTRENLARTIDTLADRVSPASNVRRFKERAAQELAKPEVQLATVAAAVALTGFVIYRIWARRRR